MRTASGDPILMPSIFSAVLCSVELSKPGVGCDVYSRVGWVRYECAGLATPKNWKGSTFAGVEKSELKVSVPTSGLGADWGVGYEKASGGCGFGGLISRFEGTTEGPRSWVNSLRKMASVESKDKRSVDAVLSQSRCWNGTS